MSPNFVLIILIIGAIGILIFIIYPYLGPYTALIAPIIAILIFFANYYAKFYEFIDYCFDTIGINRCSSLRTSLNFPSEISKFIVPEHGIYEQNEHYSVRIKPYDILFNRKNNQSIAIFINKILGKIANKLKRERAEYLCYFQGLSNEQFAPIIDEQLSIRHVAVNVTNVTTKINSGDRVVILETFLFNMDHLEEMMQSLLHDLNAQLIYIFILFSAVKKKKVISEIRQRGLNSKKICFGWYLDIGKHFAGNPICGRLPDPIKIFHKDL